MNVGPPVRSWHLRREGALRWVGVAEGRARTKQKYPDARRFSPAENGLEGARAKGYNLPKIASAIKKGNFCCVCKTVSTASQIRRPMSHGPWRLERFIGYIPIPKGRGLPLP